MISSFEPPGLHYFARKFYLSPVYFLGELTKAVPLRQINRERQTFENLFYDSEHNRKFIKACHRGFDIAQKSIIKEIDLIWSIDEISYDEKFYRELLYRKIADLIAFTMLETKTHVGRRLILHLSPYKADLQILKRDLKEAEKLNSESRLTFALLADLTTFIHVFDILRVDFRKRPKLDFIELKSGDVNSLILSELDKFSLDNTLIKKIKHDNIIPKKYESQAKRIVKQKLRLKNIHEILQKDAGYDTESGERLLLTKNEFEVESYDSFINNMCDESNNRNIVSGTFQYCIHIGVGNSDNRDTSVNYAYNALKYAFVTSLQRSENDFDEVVKEIHSLIEPKDYLKIFNPLNQNLFATECKPFLSWDIDIEHILQIVRGNLVILIGFDVTSFIWIGRKMGYDVKLTSRKKASEMLAKFGSMGVPLWNKMALEIKIQQNSRYLLSGLLLRFVNHFSSPLQYFNERVYEIDSLTLEVFNELDNDGVN